MKNLTESIQNAVATEVYHHSLEIKDKSATDYIWENTEVIPFDELIVSWNAMRPQYGAFVISVSIKKEEWTPWFSYAYWGSSTQWGGDTRSEAHSVEIEQDILSILKGGKATGFRVRVEAVEGASLDEFYALHACASRIHELTSSEVIMTGPSIDLKVPLVSQMALQHVRKRDMCSPTSTSAAISYLLKKNRLDPVAFALHSHDDMHDIFGNWVLNTAHAASVMGKDWNCWVQRLKGFNGIYRKLQEGTPVVVSVRGPLTGSAVPNTSGHLMVVKGYRAADNHVLCMDPGFPDDKSTEVSYKLTEFLEAWSRRRYVAYVFKQNCL